MLNGSLAVQGPLCRLPASRRSDMQARMGVITSKQCRAARGVLGWEQKDLARESLVSDQTIRRFEKDQHTPKPATLLLLRLAFERDGITLLDTADNRTEAGRGGKE